MCYVSVGTYYCVTMSLIALSTIVSTLVIYISHNYGHTPVPKVIERVRE